MDLNGKLDRLERSKSTDRRPALWRTSYWVTKVARGVLGEERTTKALLDVAWLSRRLAFEHAHRACGREMSGSGLGMSDKWLTDRLSSSDRVLDVGCASGAMSARIAPFVREVVGIDHDLGAVAVAAKREIPNATFRVVELEDGMPNSENYDVAILSHVLEHVVEPEQLLRELTMVAARLLIEVPDFESDALNFARVLLDRPFYTDGDHAREYCLDTLKSHLAASGWRPADIHYSSGSLLVVAELA